MKIKSFRSLFVWVGEGIMKTIYKFDGDITAEYKYDVLLDNAKNNPNIDYVVKRYVEGDVEVRNLVNTYREEIE